MNRSNKRIPTTGWAHLPDALDRAQNYLEDSDDGNVERETESISGPKESRDKLKRAKDGSGKRSLLDQIEAVGKMFEARDRQSRRRLRSGDEFEEPVLNSSQVPQPAVDSPFEEEIVANRENAARHSTKAKVAPRNAFDAKNADAIYAAAMRAGRRGYARDSAPAVVVHRAVAKDMAYLATPLSPHLARTPDGFLVAQAVPFCRTGAMNYRRDELADPDHILGDGPADEMIRVWRSPEEVFSPQCMASFEGSVVTLGHPSDLLEPNSVQHYAVGHAQNIRRGEPLESGDLPLLADLIINDAEAIRAVQSGIREVSAGYSYRLIKNGGRFEQEAIRGNHIAIVSAARAGSDVRIMDSAPARSWRPSESHIERETRENDAIYSACMKASRR